MFGTIYWTHYCVVTRMYTFNISTAKTSHKCLLANESQNQFCGGPLNFPCFESCKTGLGMLWALRPTPGLLSITTPDAMIYDMRLIH